VKKISVISDVHVQVPNDKAYYLLLSFLNHPTVRSSTDIVLLGDIFDLMCGQHGEYGLQFKQIWDAINSLLNQGKNVYYFEGNHDLHLEKLFERLFSRENFKLLKDSLVIDDIYFSHGDDHDYLNTSYQNYKKFITRPELNYIANNLVPYFILEHFGRQASKKSRTYGALTFNEVEVREKFRLGALRISDENIKTIVAGHSHVKDMVQLGNGKLYINNGFPLTEGTFLLIEKGKSQFINLAATSD